MIPKTIAYVYIVWVGYKAFKERSLTGDTDLGRSEKVKSA